MKNVNQFKVEEISIEETIKTEGGWVPRIGPIFPIRVLIWILS